VSRTKAERLAVRKDAWCPGVNGADRESPGEVYVRKARESGNRGAEHLRSTQLTLGIATLDYFYIKWDSFLFLHRYTLQSTLLLFRHWGPR
jgi:hypothetical protein